MLDVGCAYKLASEKSDLRDVIAMEMGYPSLLLGSRTEEEIIQTLHLIVQEGDHGFFSSDPYIVPALRKLAEESNSNVDAIEDIHDFALSAQPLQSGLQTALAFNINQYLQYLPVSKQSKQAELFSEWCKNESCVSKASDCSSSVSLQDKLDLVSGKQTVEQFFLSCSQNPESIKLLRKAGIIDSYCSSTMQINRVLQSQAKIDDLCFYQEFSFENGAANSADIARYLRFLYNELGTFKDKVPMENIRFIEKNFPAIGIFFTE
jgi:hypothetical protein